jgi:transcription elongation factor Elf1
MKNNKINSEYVLSLLTHSNAMKNYCYLNCEKNMSMGIELGALHTKLDQLYSDLFDEEEEQESFNKFSSKNHENEKEINEDGFGKYLEEINDYSSFQKYLEQKEENLNLSEINNELKEDLEDLRKSEKSLLERLELLESVFEDLIKKNHICATSLDLTIEKISRIYKPKEYFYALLPPKSLKIEK